MNKNNIWVALAGNTILILVSLSLCSCSPHFYKGKVAEVRAGAGIEVLVRQTNYGDCYRLLRRVPIVWQAVRPRYTIIIVHGNRYWPVLYLAAEMPKGLTLHLEGPLVKPLDSFSIATDLRQLQLERGIHLTHCAWGPNLYDQDSSFTFKVKDASGRILGEETIEFEILKVNCYETDSI